MEIFTGTLEITIENLWFIVKIFIKHYQSDVFSAKVKSTGERDRLIFNNNRMEIIDPELKAAPLQCAQIYLEDHWSCSVLAFPINPLRSHITIEFNQNYPEFRPIIDNLWDFILATVNDKTPQDKITPLYKNEKPKIEPIKSDLPDNTSIELDDLQMAGLAWIDRDRSVGDRSDFLKIWQDPDLGRKYHTVDDLKKICHQLCEIGLCEMGSNRRWKLTKTGKQLVRVYKLSPSFT